MKSLIRACLVLLLVSLSFVRTDAEETAFVEQMPWLFTAGGLTTESYSEGIADVVIPLLFNGRGLWYINPRFSFTDRSEEEYNLGFGYRHLMWDDAAVLGFNTFYDRRETARGASFNQVGFGAEFLSYWVDARANVYLPVNKESRVNTFTTTEESAVGVRRTETAVQWDDPHASGHSIFQDFDVEQRTFTRTTTTATSRLFHEYEIAMRGWDAEIGARLPIERIDDYVRFKTFGGYYKYYGRRGLDDVSGFRGRLEVHVKPAFLIDAVYYSDDDLTGGNYSVGAYVSLPFDISNIARGRNPFAGATERWDAGSRAGNMRYRLVDMVKRDPQIRSLLSEPEEDESARTTKTRTTSRTDLKKIDEGTETVATDITFVDQNRGDDANPGTYEEPKQTVQGGVDEPRSMVFVFKEGNPYNEIVTMTENVILRGEGLPIQVFGGKVFGSGIHPTINGGGLGPTITMAANTSVSGFRINNIGNTGIFSATGENLHIADNIIHNTLQGVHIETVGDVNVLLENNQFFDYGPHGALIDGTGASGSYFVNARNNSFMGGTYGLRLEADNYDSVFAVVHGLQASDAVYGLHADLSADFATLMSVSNIHAHDNVFGVYGRLASDGLAAMLGGIPQELMGLIGEIIGGGPLPPEMEALLGSGGPIQVNDNTAMGMDLVVAGDALAAMLLLDVEASRNDISGVNAFVWSDNGVALGFAGSSESLVNTLGFFGPLLGLDTTSLPNLATGPARFNDNEVTGLNMVVDGDFLSLGVAMGIEASGNELVAGVDVSVTGDGIGLAILQGIEANDNGLAGVNVGVNTGMLGLAALLDIHASDNGLNGINMWVESDTAIGFLASTDPFRNLIELLDPSMTLPGTPFGPVVVSGNGSHGVNANIEGEFLALGAFFDVHATDNGIYGIQSIINSPDGMALGLFASSDQLFEIGAPLLGGLLFGDPDAIPVPDYMPMGNMQLSGNQGGLFADISGEFGATLLMLGVDAMDNTMDIGPGIGLTLNLDGGQADALAALLNVAVNDNEARGILLNAEAEGVIDLILLQVAANNNGAQGIDINAVSEFDEIGLLMAGVQAHGNALHGVRADLDAGGDLFVMLTGVHSTDNHRHGFLLNAEVGGEALVLIAPDAITQLNSLLGGELDFLDPAADGALAGLVGAGPSSFSNNGLDPSNPGSRAGMRLNIEADEEILLSIEGNTFNANTGNGVHLDLISDNAFVIATLTDNTASGNDLSGFRVVATGDDDPGGSAHVEFQGNTADNNGGSGAWIALAGDVQEFFGENNLLRNNNIGFRLATSAGSTHVLDFGDAGVETAGNNSLFGNTTFDLRFNGPGTLKAENNWWGADSDPALDGKIGGPGTVDSTPWLTTDPNP